MRPHADELQRLEEAQVAEQASLLRGARPHGGAQSTRTHGVHAPIAGASARRLRCSGGSRAIANGATAAATAPEFSLNLLGQERTSATQRIDQAGPATRTGTHTEQEQLREDTLHSMRCAQ